MSTQNSKRILLMAAALLSLLVAMWAGLIRLGWGWPAIQPTLPMAHGPLMVSGFLGTLISLERAVALDKKWSYFAPLLSGAGAALLIVGMSGWIGPLLITMGSVLLVLIMVQILRIHITLYTGVIIAGTLCWLVGNLLWLLGWPVYQIVIWWIGFPLLTVAGERLELGRFLQLSVRVIVIFIACVGVFIAGAAIAMVLYAFGVRLAGVGMVLLALWLLHYDIASRRIKAGGQARFIAISLLSGYVWLAFGGGVAILYGGLSAGPLYDLMLHTIFLGFVFTMIFAHAPIIFPAVLQRKFVYSPRLYSHLILLHGTLMLRVAGDLLFWEPGRLWGGVLNALVILLFLGNTLISIRK
ncbi:MAG: hypothetical protein H6645_09920 [Caldilineaceae bacterium]|nr:hypothetical protein [Caldilineaceae bacterium]MCB9157421.1 hypothetical protein [Caldilineaceae bacterium]